MAAAAEPLAHQVERVSPEGDGAHDDLLHPKTDGKPVALRLRISRLSARLVADLPDRALDLLEVAALVYGADASVSRGGPADQKMGAKWHRRFAVRMSVRDFPFWSRADVGSALEETLTLLVGETMAARRA